MSVSRVVFGSLIAALILGVGSAGCTVSVKTKTRYTQAGVSKQAPAAWTGGPISINILGVGAAVNGGVTVTSDPSTSIISATARLAALADTQEDANASIADAQATFSVTTDGTGVTNIVCQHGGDHGSSSAGSSGCELVEISIPAGTAAQPLVDLKVLGGNGTMTLNLSNATIKNLGANEDASDIVASLPATQGGSISLVTQEGGDLTVTMPPTWAADHVTLQADTDKIQNAFTDLTLTEGQGSRGTAGTGLATLKLTSTSFAGSTGTITLH
jgi:hypothetical protein